MWHPSGAMVGREAAITVVPRGRVAPGCGPALAGGGESEQRARARTFRELVLFSHRYAWR